MARPVPRLQSAGVLLQHISFGIGLLLFAALAAPQFANDKEALAVISLIGFGFWLIGYLLGGTDRRSSNIIDALVLFYFGAHVVASCGSHYFIASLKGLAKVAVYVLCYFYLTGLINKQSKRKVGLVLVLALVATAVSLYGFYQYKMGIQPLATWEDPTVEVKGTRIFGTLGNPNLLAGYLLPIVALSCSLALPSLKRWFVSIPFICSSAIIAVATVLTGSRGGYLGLLATVLAFVGIASSYLWNKKPKARLPIVLGLVLSACLLVLVLHFVPTFEQRVSSIFAGREHSSNSFRLNVWLSSWRMFLDNWWIGIGSGNQTFRLAYGLYMISGFDALGTYCVPLEMAVEIGVVGALGYFLMITGLLARAHVSFWTDETWTKWITAGAAASLVGMMVHGLVDTVFFRPQVQFIFWLLVALLSTAPLPNSNSDHGLSQREREDLTAIAHTTGEAG